MHPGAEWVLQPVRDGEWWNVVGSNAPLSATAIHGKPAALPATKGAVQCKNPQENRLQAPKRLY